MARSSLVKRIENDPVYRAVIKLAGYLGTAFPIGQEEAARLKAEFGEANVLAAAEKLLDFDGEGKIARLKPGVRRLCRPILGPSPEDWDDFCQGVENPPPNPYRQEIEAVAEAVAEAVRKETGHDAVVQPDKQNPEKRVIGVMPPPANPNRPFADHTDKRLLELLDRNQYEMTRCKPRSVSFREAFREIGLITAELQRRDSGDLVAPPPSLRRRG
jgi:hypothetical protein